MTREQGWLVSASAGILGVCGVRDSEELKVLVCGDWRISTFQKACFRIPVGAVCDRYTAHFIGPPASDHRRKRKARGTQRGLA